MITYYGLFTPGCGVGYLPPMAKHMCSNRAMVQEVALVLSSLSSPVSIWKICSQDVIFAIDILFTFNVTVWTPGGYMISRRNPVESNLESADHVPTKSPQPWMDQIDPNKEVILHQESNINLAVEQQIYTAIPKSLNELWFDSHFFTVVRVVRCPLWLWQGLILPRDTGGVATWHIWHRCGVREMAWTCTEWSECDLNVIFVFDQIDLQISSGRLCLDILATAPVDLIGELVRAPSGNLHWPFSCQFRCHVVTYIKSF